MSHDLDELDKKLREDTKHARRGGCLALFIFPPIVLAICWAVFALTPGGQTVTAWATLYLTHDGLPVHEYVEGFPGIARYSCSLDRQNPKPQNYQETQERLEGVYISLLDAYRAAYQDLQRSNQDLSQFENPDEVPGNLSSARLYYCRR
jgi:hypothetical protein